MNYQTYKTQYKTTRKRKLANNTYLVKGDNYYAIELHGSQIIKFYPDKTVLSSCGWRTVTTKARLNEFSGFNIWQIKGIWYIGQYCASGCEKSFNTASVVFADDITFTYKKNGSGKWSNTGPKPEKTQKLRKQVKQYAKDFVKALFTGQVPKPSSSDCWYCGMVTEDHTPLGEAIKDQSHISNHIKENYFVPSLCVNACKTFGVSVAAQSCLAVLWNDKYNDSEWPSTTKETNLKFYSDIAKPQIESAIRRYCYRQLKTA